MPTTTKRYYKRKISASEIKKIRNEVIKLWGKAAVQFETYNVGKMFEGDEFSSFEKFWNTYRKTEIDSIDIRISAGIMEREVDIDSSMDNELSVRVSSPDEEDIDILFGAIEEILKLQEKIQIDSDKLVSYSRIYHGRNTWNYGIVGDIKSYVESKWRITKFSPERYVLDWGYEKWDYFDFQSFLGATHRNSRDLKSAKITFGDAEGRSLMLELGKVNSSIEITDLETSIKDIVNYVEEKLSLERKKLLVERSAFIAHRFDQKGKEISGIVRECLEVLGFKVVTGERFAPQPISEKIKDLINKQAIFIVIHSKPEKTSGPDVSQWLIEETTFALDTGKLVFQFVEEGIKIKQGLRGDLEEIRYTPSDFSRPLIKLIAGIRERYLI